MTTQQEMKQVYQVVKIVKRMNYDDQVAYIQGIHERWENKGLVALIAKTVWGT